MADCRTHHRLGECRVLLWGACKIDLTILGRTLSRMEICGPRRTFVPMFESLCIKQVERQHSRKCSPKTAGFILEAP